MFSKESRYAAVGEHAISGHRGRLIRYKKTRFIAETGVQMAHMVGGGERLDHLAYHYYRDPERFWRICDANRALWPPELVAEPGRTIAIPPVED